jgi:LemA protein
LGHPNGWYRNTAQKLIILKNDKSVVSELKELAISMGLSDLDWDNLLNEAEGHLKVAEKHLSARNFVDAVEAADKATAINPYIKDGNSILAQAFLMQWIDDNDVEKRNKAEFYARKEIKVDPNDKRAINVLSTVQNKKRISGEGAKIKKYIFIAAGIIAVLLLFSVISNSSSQDSSLKNQLIDAEENVSAKWGDIQAALDRKENLESKTSSTIEIEGAENRINFARKDYNQAVKDYNSLVKKNSDDFPEYKTKDYFE